MRRNPSRQNPNALLRQAYLLSCSRHQASISATLGRWPGAKAGPLEPGFDARFAGGAGALSAWATAGGGISSSTAGAADAVAAGAAPAAALFARAAARMSAVFILPLAGWAAAGLGAAGAAALASAAGAAALFARA